MSACRIVSRPIYLVEILVETEIMYMKDLYMIWYYAKNVWLIDLLEACIYI